MPAINMQNLTKYYGKTLGIKDVTLNVEKGCIFGFLGANGAGKTTAIRILLGLLKPTAGHVEILETQITGDKVYPEKLHAQLGFLPGELRLYEDMTGKAFLDYMASFYENVDKQLQMEALDMVKLSSQDLSRKISQYSRGMKQKLGIVQAIQHKPQLIIMDEPTEGLDPLMQQSFYLLIERLRDRGSTVFMSSHNLAEVERVCQKVAIIREGRIVAIEDVNSLKDKRLYNIEILFKNVEQAEKFNLQNIEVVKGEGNKLVFRWKGRFSSLFENLSDFEVEDFICRKASLEEVFLTYYADEGDEASE